MVDFTGHLFAENCTFLNMLGYTVFPAFTRLFYWCLVVRRGVFPITNIVELSEYVLEPLREDEEFILSQGRPRRAEAPSVLLLAPTSTRPAPESLKKIEHEYSFRAELDAAWAVVPLALSQYGEQRVLVLENPGGELPIASFKGRWKCSCFCALQ